MKTLFRILIIATCLGIIYYYSNVEPSITELLEGPSQIIQPVSNIEDQKKNQNNLPRPTTGISKFIGQSHTDILDNYGKPDRIDPSEFGYEWWMYHGNDALLMVGIEDGMVTQIYTNSPSFNTAPYVIDQSLDDVYRMTIFEQEVTVQIEGNLYIFAMNEQDMHSRILVNYEGLYAQLYIDTETNKLDGVRFIDGKTLVLHKPYELQFVGELLEATTPSSFQQVDINRANGLQLTDLANAYRQKNRLPVLLASPQLNLLAETQSEGMLLESMATQATEPTKSLDERLNEIDMVFQSAAENVASNYKDSIEVMYGWINSKEHREWLLNDKLTLIGSGTFVNYYTQIYIEQNIDSDERYGL